MSILVTGGAGYIGSHMVSLLERRGANVVVIDNLSSGRREAVSPTVPLLVADVADRAQVELFLRTHQVTTIYHFASRIQVGESVVRPRLYYKDNLGATIALVESALEVGVKEFILSSTAAVYGDPVAVPLVEDHPTTPINPYGETKLAVEKMLASYARAYELRYAALRYFNAAGADAEAGLGECHDPETHLIPIVLQVALGQRDKVTVFGRDYPTPDGTCVRDYIHVVDLCEAHFAASAWLAKREASGASGAFNLGTGRGYSVLEVIDAARKVTGKNIAVDYGARRDGDPPALVASPKRAETELGWKASRSSLDEIVRDAWAWAQKAPTHR
jgi:UDP-glucose 4-epimerase